MLVFWTRWGRWGVYVILRHYDDVWTIYMCTLCVIIVTKWLLSRFVDDCFPVILTNHYNCTFRVLNAAHVWLSYWQTMCHIVIQQRPGSMWIKTTLSPWNPTGQDFKITPERGFPSERPQMHKFVLVLRVKRLLDQIARLHHRMHYYEAVAAAHQALSMEDCAGNEGRQNASQTNLAQKVMLTSKRQWQLREVTPKSCSSSSSVPGGLSKKSPYEPDQGGAGYPLPRWQTIDGEQINGSWEVVSPNAIGEVSHPGGWLNPQNKEWIRDIEPRFNRYSPWVG